MEIQNTSTMRELLRIAGLTLSQGYPKRLANALVPVLPIAIPLPKILYYSDTSLNNSNKTFSVPRDKIWKVKSIFAQLVTTASVGNRNLQLEIYNPSSLMVYPVPTGGTQAASLTYNYMYNIFGVRSGSAATQFSPLPDIFLEPNSSIKIWDLAAIDAAADDLSVQMVIEEYDR